MTQEGSADPATALDDLVGRALRLMSGGQDEAAEGPFTGTAADGLVRCEVGPDGRVRSVDLDPRVLRLPLAELSAHLRTAVNEALDARPAPPDTSQLLDGLRAVQEQSVLEMRRITQAFSAALEGSTGRRA